MPSTCGFGLSLRAVLTANDNWLWTVRDHGVTTETGTTPFRTGHGRVISSRSVGVDWATAGVSAGAALLGAAAGGFGSWLVSKSAFEREAKARASERLEERKLRRVRLLQGLLAEVRENMDARPWDAGGLKSVYVRDIWRATKDQVGSLPDEVRDATRAAYAQAARFNGFVGWARSAAGLSDRFDAFLTGEGETAHQAFGAAESVLAFYLRAEQEGEGDVSNDRSQIEDPPV